jgi:hypothetical protein
MVADGAIKKAFARAVGRARVLGRLGGDTFSGSQGMRSSRDHGFALRACRVGHHSAQCRGRRNEFMTGQTPTAWNLPHAGPSGGTGYLALPGCRERRINPPRTIGKSSRFYLDRFDCRKQTSSGWIGGDAINRTDLSREFQLIVGEASSVRFLDHGRRSRPSAPVAETLFLT